MGMFSCYGTGIQLAARMGGFEQFQGHRKGEKKKGDQIPNVKYKKKDAAPERVRAVGAGGWVPERFTNIGLVSVTFLLWISATAAGFGVPPNPRN